MPVYFVRAGERGAVKIGTANDPRRRVAALQTAHCDKLGLLRLLAGDEEIERAAHAHFAGFRLRGEWFAFDDAMLAADLPARLGTYDIQIAPEKPLTTLEQFIAQLGGNAAMARICGVGLPAVSNWKARGAIPAGLFLLLFRHCRNVGIDINEDLFGEPFASKERPKPKARR